MSNIIRVISNSLILKTTFWSGVNILLQYGVGFLITVLIAAQLPPDDFGIYQIALAYIALFEVVHPIHPNHARSLLANDSESVGLLAGSWRMGTVLSSGVLILLTLAVFIISENFWLKIFFAIGTFRVFAKFNEYGFILSDNFNGGGRTQRVQTLQHCVFNFARSAVVFGMGMKYLLTVSIFHGFFNMAAQKSLINSGFKIQIRYSKQHFGMVVRTGFLLAVFGVFVTLQQRAFAFLLPHVMDMTSYGSFHLILKFLEPLMIVPSVVLNANFSSLMLSKDKIHLRIRLLKLSVLVLFLILLGYFLTILFKEPILAYFGSGYDLSSLGSVSTISLLLASACFQFYLYYCQLTRRYLQALSSLICSLVFFLLMVKKQSVQISVGDALYAYGFSMILSVLIICSSALVVRISYKTK